MLNSKIYNTPPLVFTAQPLRSVRGVCLDRRDCAVISEQLDTFHIKFYYFKPCVHFPRLHFFARLGAAKKPPREWR